MNKKVCSMCKCEKHLSDFGKNKSTKDKLQYYCKECGKKANKKHREKIKTIGREYINNKEKECRICKRILPIENFHKNKYYIDGHIYECKECRTAIDKQRKDYHAKYNQLNKSKRAQWYKNNQEKAKNRQKEYYKTEIGKANTKKGNYKRRAKIKQVADLGAYTTAEWKECLDKFDYCDAYTGEPLGEDVTIDHIIPISKGGTNNINNIVPCKKAINSSKHNSLLNEWYPKQSFYNKERHNKINEWIKEKSQITLFEL